MQYRNWLLLSFLLVSDVSGRLSSKIESKIHTVQRYYLDSHSFNSTNTENELPVKASMILDKFTWSSCSGPDALLTIDKLDVTDPVVIPGDVTVSVSSSLSEDIGAPLKTKVEVQRKVGFLWIKVPCVEGFGSCTYDDFCQMSPFPPEQPCPEALTVLGLPCNCPVSKGKYNIDGGVIPIPDEHLPEFLARGLYNIKVQVTTEAREVACLKIYISLS